MNSSALRMQGLRDALPIMMAYFPLALTFGVLAVSSGLPWYIAVLISIWVYSGGAQFMLLSMFTAAASPLSIITSIMLVNLRHFLYGTTMGPYMAHWSEKVRWLGAHGLTDEVFVVTSSRASSGEKLESSYYLSFAFWCYGSWIAGTLVGAAIGRIVPPQASDVLGFALPALFLALLFAGERTWPHLFSAITGAIVACICSLIGLGSLGVVLGGVIGATVGLFLFEQGHRIRLRGNN